MWETEVEETHATKRYGVVTLLDALGTKGKWKAEAEAKEHLKNWESIYNKVQFHTRTADAMFDHYADHGAGKRLDSFPLFDFSIFSDTVLLVMCNPNSDYYSLTRLIYVTDLVLFSIRKGIFFRGVISAGSFYLVKDNDKSLLIGSAVDEAAEIYDSYDWIGVVAAPSATLIIEKLWAEQKQTHKTDTPPLMQNLFIRYDLPHKSKVEKNGLALAWPRAQESIVNGKQDYSNYLLIHLDPKKYQENPMENSIYIKYRNTLEFYYFVKQNSNFE